MQFRLLKYDQKTLMQILLTFLALRLHCSFQDASLQILLFFYEIRQQLH